jgi:general secretion pathway protein G
LIELLLVLVIIAVLAAVVVPKLVGRSEDARKKATVASIDGIKNALANFEVDNGRFPSTSEGLMALVEQPSGLTNWHGPYVEKQQLEKDAWDHPFVYRYPGTRNQTGFDVSSMGPDGQEGGPDDIGN